MQGEKKVYLIGIGLGTPEGLTVEAKQCLQEGDVFIGARRMLEILPEECTRRFESYQPEEICQYLRENAHWQRACILLSGDVGFYSGAKKLLVELSCFEVRLVPGISSLAGFCAKLCISWEDVSYGSIHGRKENLIARICRNRYTFALLGGQDSLFELCRKLTYFRLEDVILHVGERLGYPQERIVHGRVSEIGEMSFDRLLVAVVENPSPRRQMSAEIQDEDFIRGNVPMTKCEVRTISIQKMGLAGDSVLYDIGAGTGSVSIQAGMYYPDCDIYAIEEKVEARELIEKNKCKFAVDNVTVVEGQAPEVLKELPPPTHVFVGGSGGRLRQILQSVYEKNPEVIVVLNFVSLEGLSELVQLTKEWKLEGVQAVQVSVSKSREIGQSHLMMAQNPVTIVTIPTQKKTSKSTTNLFHAIKYMMAGGDGANMLNQHGGDVYSHPGVLDFSTNSNPLPTSAPILEAVQDSIKLLSQYPDCDCRRLRKALAGKLSCFSAPIDSEDIICGNGAAELLFTLVLARKPRKALLTVPGFLEYEAALESVGTEIIYATLREDNGFALTGEFLSFLKEDMDMVFLCSPHNPTGGLIDRELLGEIADFCEKKRILLVMDECFQDFLQEPSRHSLLPELAQRRYVFILKSFTKLFGLAGVRLGYGVTKNRKLLEQMKRCRQPWPVSVPAQMAGLAALEQEEYVRLSREYVRRERKFLCEGLRKAGWKVYEPSANFIFFQGPSGLQEKLLEKGILIRDCSNYRGLGQGYYRIAVKNHEENERLLDSI